MKKLIGLIFVFNCLFLSHLSAFVIETAHGTTIERPPQYVKAQKSILPHFSIKKLVKGVTKSDQPIDLNRTARLALILSLAGLALIIGGFVIAGVTGGVIGVGSLIVWILAFVSSLIGFIKGRKVTKDDSSTRRQRRKARIAKIISATTWAVLFLLCVVFYFAITSGD